VSDRLMTLLSVAVVLSCSQRTVRRLIAQGDLPVYRVGGGLRVRESDVGAYIESHRIERPSERSGLKALVARAVQRARERRSS
jgi:excisionase family DNA binding protein